MKEIDILLVDDDPFFGELIVKYLVNEGFIVESAKDGEDMRQKLTQVKARLILLDLNLPDSRGLELAKELRSGSNIGIIILTGSDDNFDRILGLELGADDYVIKGTENRELAARIRSVLRRIDMDKKTGKSIDVGHRVASFAKLTLDCTAHKLTDENGEIISLTSHEYALLTYFVENPNRVLSRDQLMQKLSGRDWYPNDRSIDTLIVKLRKKIEKDPKNPSLIKTMRGSGYIFTCQVDLQKT